MGTKPLVKLAFMQIAAVIYGVLATATCCKIAQISLESTGYAPPFAYIMALAFRNLGFFLFVPVVIWTALFAYFTSPFSSRSVSQPTTTCWGLSLAIFYALLGTFFAFCAITPMIRV